MIRVTIKDMRATGTCVPQTRVWFAKHNLDFKDFMRNGIDAQSLIDTNDNQDHVRLVIESAKKRENLSGR